MLHVNRHHDGGRNDVVGVVGVVDVAALSTRHWDAPVFLVLGFGSNETLIVCKNFY